MSNEVFSIEKRIYYHDTDCGGVVYYANYLKYLEEARTEHLRSKGIDLIEVAKEGIIFAVADAAIKYKSPARYGDIIKITSRIENMGAASIVFYQEIKEKERLLVECRTTLVSLKPNFRVTPIPNRIERLLR